MLKTHQMSMNFKFSPLVSRNLIYKVFRLDQCGYKTQSSKRPRILKAKKNDECQFIDEQLKVLEAVSKGKSVFITGSAGTGKTQLLKEVISRLRKIHGNLKVFVTASTGVAACALNGQTLHSFAGIGIGDGSREDLESRVLKYKWIAKRWKSVKALVIDEVSMVDAKLFEDLEHIARFLRPRHKNKPWGGIQLVVAGDFYQLPPVRIANPDDDDSSDKVYAFEAECWDASFDLQMVLLNVFRQLDPQLVKLLQGVRTGECDYDDINLLRQRCSDTVPEESVVRLYPTKSVVNRVNKTRLLGLNERIMTYDAVDTGDDPWKRQLKQGIVLDCLEICKGARVMLIKNLNVKQKLVNGSTGTVTGFHDKSDLKFGLLPIVKFDSGREMVVVPDTWVVMECDRVLATRTQIPLVLAWALTIHKCQGMTLERLHTDLSRAFGYGMVYVALSRVKSLEGLHLSGFKEWKIKAHPKVLQFYKRLMNDGKIGASEEVLNMDMGEYTCESLT